MIYVFIVLFTIGEGFSVKRYYSRVYLWGKKMMQKLRAMSVKVP